VLVVAVVAAAVVEEHRIDVVVVVAVVVAVDPSYYSGNHFHSLEMTHVARTTYWEALLVDRIGSNGTHSKRLPRHY
jgi:hypothetical protein